jgi:heptosyltransferase-3
MKIAVYMIGSLGDTLAAIPALWALRRNYCQDELILVTDSQLNSARVGAREILEGSNLVDGVEEYFSYESQGSRIRKLMGAGRLWALLRAMNPALLVYLLRGTRDQARIRRDLLFFRSAGISRIIGLDGMPLAVPPRLGKGIRLSSQAEQFLVRLAAAGIPVPPPGQGRCDLGLTRKDESAFREWADRQAPDAGRRWVAFAPGSKMPSKRWPAERYAEVGRRLIESHDIWPVIFGGAEDVETGGMLLQAWRRGAMAAGSLGVRAAAAGLSRCALYVGNDTGTMHLAASAGRPCVALFSARDYRGLWEPYGNGHTVLRSDPPCAECFGLACPRGDNHCLERITADQAVEACRQVLERKPVCGWESK